MESINCRPVQEFENGWRSFLATNEPIKCVECDIRDIIEKFEKQMSITAVDCARVARCIVVAWTHLVHPVIWISRPSEEKNGGESDGSSPPAYFPVHLEELPDVSAWE
jgi:hypothetical protein